MATPPKYPPQPQPIADSGNGWRVTREWLAFFQGLVSQAAGAGTVTAVTASPPLTSTGGTTPNIALSDTAVTPGTYGDATHVGRFTVDAKGRLTAASNVAIGPAGQQYMPVFVGGLAVTMGDEIVAVAWSAPTT